MDKVLLSHILDLFDRDRERIVGIRHFYAYIIARDGNPLHRIADAHDRILDINNGQLFQFLWKPWADENGYLGPIYGVNIRSWYVDRDKPPIDQLALLIDNIKKNPYSRRHVITAWHVSLLDEMSLVPCHAVSVQFYIRND